MYIIKLIHIYTNIYTYIHTHTSTRVYVNICIRPHEVPRQVTLNRQKGRISRDKPGKAREGRPYGPPGPETAKVT